MKDLTIHLPNYCWLRPWNPPMNLDYSVSSLHPPRNPSLSSPNCIWCHPSTKHNPLAYFTSNNSMPDYTKSRLSCSGRLLCPRSSIVPRVTQLFSSSLELRRLPRSWGLRSPPDSIRAELSVNQMIVRTLWFRGRPPTRVSLGLWSVAMDCCCWYLVALIRLARYRAGPLLLSHLIVAGYGGKYRPYAQ